MAQYAANEIENLPDSPVAREDLGAGGIPRGAGARSPLFWKVLLLSVAVIWGYSFTTMKDALGTIPVFALLYVRFLPAALVMFAVFHKRIIAHLNARNLIVGLSMGVLMWAAYALQTVGLAHTTAGKNAFLTGTYCILVPFASYFLSGEKLTRYNLGAALLCLAGIGLVALDSVEFNIGDVITLAGAAFFAIQMAVTAKYGRKMDINVITFWMFVGNGVLSLEQYQTAKKYGFQDKTIKRLAQVEALPVENYRAGFKMVDTCAAEFSANTPYFYSTYDGDNEAAEFIAAREAEAAANGQPKKKKVLVFGSGPIRIGQGIEFDYCSVHCVWTLKNHGCEAILVNNNPETVSTDFDTGDRLYFDPLNPESVDNIIATEKPDACVVQFGGQTAIKLAKHMDEIGLPILGTPADAIDEAEDRERFDELLERCKIPRAPGRTVFNLEEALAAADEIGLPVLMRPSYVLGGQNMIVAYTKADVIEYMGVITEHVDMDHPVLLDKYIMGTECEVDAICDGENFLIPGVMEQVERTGVHSGDSICVYPAQHLTQAEIDTMVDYTGRFARELHVTGLVNVQYAVSNGKVYVIEVNPRSSRTVPYISKVTGVPMVDLAVRCCLGEKLVDMGYGTGLHPNAPYVAVKVPVFSFEKLHGVDTQFGPEMKSTGEVLGIAPNYHDALLKGLIGAGYTFKTPGPASCCIFTVKDSDKPEFVDIAWKLKSMGYKLYGTSGTCAWLNKHMVPCNEVRPMSGESPNIVDLLQSGLVDYVFSTSAKGRDPKRDSVRLRRKAVELSIPCITAVDTANALVNCLRSDHSLENIPLVDIATLYHRK